MTADVIFMTILAVLFFGGLAHAIFNNDGKPKKRPTKDRHARRLLTIKIVSHIIGITLISCFVSYLFFRELNPFNQMEILWSRSHKTAIHIESYSEDVSDYSDHGERGRTVKVHVYQYSAGSKKHKVTSTTEADTMKVVYNPNRPYLGIPIDMEFSETRHILNDVIPNQLIIILLGALGWAGILKIKSKLA